MLGMLVFGPILALSCALIQVLLLPIFIMPYVFRARLARSPHYVT